MSKGIKGFYQYSKSWYSKVLAKPDNFIDDVYIGIYNKESDGGYSTIGEFSISWTAGRHGMKDPFIKLEVHHDSWKTLTDMPELLSLLTKINETTFTADKFVTMLEEIGYINLTVARY